MNEQRIQAYINLIQQLLTCPNGEENQILNQSLDLLDAGFVQVCEQVAAQLQEQGEENQAAFLQNVAQQVAAFLNQQVASSPTNDPNTTPEDYLNFLLEVLQATRNSRGNPSVVYPLLQQNLDKLDLNFAQMLQAWASQTLAEAEANQAFNMAAVIVNFANLIKDFPLGSRAANLEIGITAYNIVSVVFTREAFPEQWAMTQNNLANAYSDRIKGDRAENLEMAIDCCQAALEVYTREAFPEQWATTQNNLGLAYSDQIKGERAENLEWAIGCFQAALEVRTREAFPQDWADTQNNLATAYLYRIKGDRAENLEWAIGCYQAALAVYTREAFPQKHTETLFNLGLAYRDAAQLENAAKTFADAIDTVEEIRSNIIIGGEAARQKLAAEWNKLYVNMVEVCLELEDYAAALEYAERGKARNLVELMAATRLKPEGVTPEVWERYDRLYQQWWNLQQQRNGSDSASNNGFGVGGFGVGDSRSVEVSASSTQKAVSEEISQRIGELNQQIDDLIAAEITPHDPKFRFGQKVEPIRYQEIQALVDEQTAIVEWYFTSKNIQAFIVTHQGQQPIAVATDSHAVEALEQLKDEYLSDYLTDDYQWQQQLPSYLQRLAEILELDRLLGEIPDYCQQLILVPYRFLHLFPLHALPVGSTFAPLGKVESP